jgi:hypothetical protein
MDAEMLEEHIKDNLCAKAIEELEEGADVNYWMQKHRELFEKVTITAPNLPRIALSHHQGVYFENISNFAYSYMKCLGE